MARRCELTGKGVQAGNNVSHAKNRSRRRFLPNVQEVRLMSDSLDRSFSLKVSAAALRSVEHNGGLDNFLLKARDEKLSLQARRVKRDVKKHGYCVVVASEGAQYKDGQFIADAGRKDAFGHTQLGGVAPALAGMVTDELGLKNHWAVADYLQRAARHIASATDVEQAYAVGEAAVEFAVAGKNAVMPIIVRKKTKRYSWAIDSVHLSKVANVEWKMPRDYISKNGYGVTQKGLDYLAPLIGGEDYPPFKNGVPDYARLKKVMVAKKLKKSFKV